MSGGDRERGADAGTEALERRANRMDLVARWADDLAHEIKNPLHAMVINLELVKRRAVSGDPGPAVERAEIVEAELHRVHALVESLLRLVRPWPPGATCAVDGVFEQLLPVLGARTRIRRIDYVHQPGGGPVAISPGDLALVLLNLIDNAIDASPEGGTLTTAVEMRREAVLVRVQDEGKGLDAGSAPDLLALTARPGRSGLGVSVSARLIREAGGDLELRSGPGGRGTEAVVVIPRVPSA